MNSYRDLKKGMGPILLTIYTTDIFFVIVEINEEVMKKSAVSYESYVDPAVKFTLFKNGKDGPKRSTLFQLYREEHYHFWGRILLDVSRLYRVSR